MPDNSRILSLLYSESGHWPPRFGTNTMLRSAIWLLRHVPHRGKLLEWRHVIGPGKGRPTPLAADGVAGVLAGIYGRPAKASSRGTPTPPVSGPRIFSPALHKLCTRSQELYVVAATTHSLCGGVGPVWQGSPSPTSDRARVAC